MLALSLFSAVLLAAQVTASAGIDDARSGLAELLQSRGLYRRQISPSDIPASCQSQCASTVAVLNDQSCVSASCLCTATVNQGFQTCLSCVAAGDPATISQAQAAIAQYEDACNQSGVPVASLSITGGSAVSTAAGGGSVSLPAGASQTPSVFFSSSGAGGGASTAAGVSTLAAGGSTPTRSIVTAAPVGTGSTSAAPSASKTPGAVSGAGSLSGASGVAVAGLIAVAGVMFAL